MKHKARQTDIKWTEPEALALIPEAGKDWEKAAREREEKEKAREAAEQNQKPLL